MDERLKQRLVGAAVISVVLVVFVPLILDDRSADPTPPTAESIPDWPDDERFQSRILPLDEETRDELAAGPPVASEKAAPAPDVEPPPPSSPEPKPEPRSEPEPRPTLAPEAPSPEVPSLPAVKEGVDTPKAWSIQLGSFADRANALGLRDTLRSQGFTAFDRKVVVDGREMTRVFVGPELLRSNAQEKLERLEKAFELKGRVVRHPQG
ncbi:MAG: SPOR domain-containing protein [Gammaproteobacteria bacterium]|nr:SPOR domain-containing protein [Gammaproteobacteria bacterium]